MIYIVTATITTEVINCENEYEAIDIATDRMNKCNSLDQCSIEFTTEENPYQMIKEQTK
jgi:hypothetical protein